MPLLPPPGRWLPSDAGSGRAVDAGARGGAGGQPLGRDRPAAVLADAVPAGQQPAQCAVHASERLGLQNVRTYAKHNLGLSLGRLGDLDPIGKMCTRNDRTLRVAGVA